MQLAVIYGSHAIVDVLAKNKKLRDLKDHKGKRGRSLTEIMEVVVMLTQLSISPVRTATGTSARHHRTTHLRSACVRRTLRRRMFQSMMLCSLLESNGYLLM